MLSLLVTSLFYLGSIVSAEIAQQCESGICYSLNIPQTTASSGDGDIFFQISAPISNSWVGLGQGMGMAASNIFVIYTSADGKNVTLSPRAGKGHVEPEHSSGPQVTLLGGSGVSNGMMTANVRCSNCNSWSGGTMNFSSNSGSWIWAMRPGPALNSDDTNEEIMQHSGHGEFNFDFTQARGGNDVNPFTNPSATTAGNNGGSSTPSGIFFSDMQRSQNILIAHAVLACLAFGLFFPMGGIVIRLLNFSGLVWLHAACQIFAYVLFIAAFGMGIWIATNLHVVDQYHPVIGIILFCLLFFQPFLGTIHHSAFKKYGRRTIWSHAHVWLGRIIITLGIINGGLGLRFAGDASGGQEAAYGVVAGLIWVAYVASIVFGEVKRTGAKERAIEGDPVFQENKEAANEHATSSA